jgi:hypothetical protein
MLRNLKLTKKNRYEKCRVLAAYQGAVDLGNALLPEMKARSFRAHLALLDDTLTTTRSTTDPNPLFVCNVPAQDILHSVPLYPGCLTLIEDAKRVLLSLASEWPDLSLHLPTFPDTPAKMCIAGQRPDAWSDERAWTFPAYGKANRVALAAMVKRPTGHVDTLPFAYAGSSGRLWHIANVLAHAECGLGWSDSKTSAPYHRDPIEALVLYNP